MNTNALEVLNTYTKNFEEFTKMFYAITMNTDELHLQGDATKQTLEFFENLKVEFQYSYKTLRGEFKVGSVRVRIVLTLQTYNDSAE